jgi:hypothetical protein
MIEDLPLALINARRRELESAAAVHRLVRIAECCKPSAVRQRLVAAVRWLRAGQLGTGSFDTASAPLTSRGCCA